MTLHLLREYVSNLELVQAQISDSNVVLIMGWEMFIFTFHTRVHHLLISFILAQINSVMRVEVHKKGILFISSKMMMMEIHVRLIGLCLKLQKD